MNGEDIPMKDMMAVLTAASVRVPGAATPKSTEVIVIEAPKLSITLQQIMAVIPAEIRAAVKLCLDGKIRQWSSRGDGKGVVFVVDANTDDQARAIMEALPLSKKRLMDDEYIPVGPLMPAEGIDGPGSAAVSLVRPTRRRS